MGHFWTHSARAVYQSLGTTTAGPAGKGGLETAMGKKGGPCPSQQDTGVWNNLRVADDNY